MKPPASSKTQIKELRASRIWLESPDGKPRALLDATAEGMVSINLYGKNSSLALGIDSDGNPKINFSNKKGKVALSLGVSDTIGNGITIHDADGVPLCFLVVTPKGTPKIRLFKRLGSGTSGMLKETWSSPLPAKAKKKPI